MLGSAAVAIAQLKSRSVLGKVRRLSESANKDDPQHLGLASARCSAVARALSSAARSGSAIHLC